MFTLDPRLEHDTIPLGHFELSLLLLMNDANYPWCILVPQREGIAEVYQLQEREQQVLWRESALLGAALMAAFRGDKLNVAALGNVVPQLHIHHIVRFQGDAAWPAPVWGRVQARPYSDGQLAETAARLRTALGSAVAWSAP